MKNQNFCCSLRIFFVKINELHMLKDYLIYCILKQYETYTIVANSFDRLFFFGIDEKKIFIDIFYELFGYHLQSVYESKKSD